MAQPPLSHQIRNLEGELGVQLLRRTTRRVELTPAGELFLERARAILQDVDDTVRDVKSCGRRSLRLQVGFTGSVTYELMPAVARRFRTEMPAVELVLRGELHTSQQTQLLLDGDLDVAVLRPPVVHPALKVETFRTERLVAALPAGHRHADKPRVRLVNLVDDAFLWHSLSTPSRLNDVVLAACEAAGFTPRIVLEVHETGTMISLVAANMGIAILPESVRNLRVSGVSYVPVSGTSVTLDLAVASRHSDSSPLVRSFCAMILELGTAHARASPAS